MSLEIYLYSKKTLTCDCGRVHEIDTDNNVFNANITSNLYRMAIEAGVGDELWNPYELDISKAGQLIEPLNNAIADMEHRPSHYQKFDAANGWGTYKDFLPWLKRLYDACKEYPNSTVEISK